MRMNQPPEVLILSIIHESPETNLFRSLVEDGSRGKKNVSMSE